MFLSSYRQKLSTLFALFIVLLMATGITNTYANKPTEQQTNQPEASNQEMPLQFQLEQQALMWELRKRIAQLQASTTAAELERQELKIRIDVLKNNTELFNEQLQNRLAGDTTTKSSKTVAPTLTVSPASTKMPPIRLHWVGSGKQKGKAVISIGGVYQEIYQGQLQQNPPLKVLKIDAQSEEVELSYRGKRQHLKL